MSTTLQSLLSKVQRNIGDEGFTKIKRAELIDLVIDSANAVAATVRLWIEQVTVTPRNVTETFTFNTVQELPGSAQVGDTAFILTTNMRYRYYDNAWEIYPYNVVKIDPTLATIAKTIQVWKNGVQCSEQSLQSINQGYASGYFYNGTNAVEPLSSGIQYAHYRRPDDGSDFIFARDFESSDTVTFIYRNEQPIIPKLWTSAINLPHPVIDAIMWETISRCYMTLYMRGDEAANPRAMTAAQKATMELSNANSYLRNLLNENSSITIQPLRWLPE